MEKLIDFQEQSISLRPEWWADKHTDTSLTQLFLTYLIVIGLSWVELWIRNECNATIISSNNLFGKSTKCIIRFQFNTLCVLAADHTTNHMNDEEVQSTMHFSR